MADFTTGKPLGAERMDGAVDPRTLGFATTADLEPLDAWPGQDRALEAVRMAAGMEHADFNLFVLGRQGTGRHSAARAVLSGAAAARPVPRDWIYVNNFTDPQRPIAIDLAPGNAELLRLAVENLIDDLANDLPAVFESEDYQARRRSIEDRFSAESDDEMEALSEKAREKDIAILRTPMGFGVAARRDGEILTPAQYDALPREERDRIDAAVAGIEEALGAILKQMPRRLKAQRRKVEELNAAMVEAAVDNAIAEARSRVPDEPNATGFLDDLRKQLVANAEVFLMRPEGAQAGPFPVSATRHYMRPQFEPFTVNVLVTNPADSGGAPVIEESLPTLSNLIGRIEYAAQQGALVTNFTMIRPGALHRANGGYLLLDAREVLTEPFAWDALKRCLSTGEVQIYSAGERLSLISTVSLTPDPIPLKARVVLVGDRLLYYMLVALDPEFPRLFKLEADFEDRMPRSAESTALYARLAGTMAQRAGLRPITAGGVARLLTEAMRAAEDAERFALDLGQMSDTIHEADYWAAAAGADSVRPEDVEAAIAAADRRAGRIRDLTQESIARGAVLIDTDGARVGQINALSVAEIGTTRFGRPSRVSVRVRAGSGKLVDIERETELGGPIHSKGVLILSGYLAGTYAPDLPMSLWASIVFEQSYGGIDGDSASAAELMALLSALAEAPIDQSLAVTGSVNQFGDVQAIGGVNEKIEGFFDVCAGRGLTGRQGVLIPASNVAHLVLRSRVVDAVREGRFRVIPFASIDEGLQLLTGRPAGDRGADGAFPPGSLNAAVEAKLRRFAELRARDLRRRPGGEDRR
ncbi:AAA family ATPase [Halovulum dunhuangense]|uniref:endopeptidase La n=1 Tax=Halovulum dunhuangense TaxID=1505036 RepID=A0A849KYV9_9RHOB|nr:ATP-binding protein [Halovulum dunhuangense]NNU78992.1 AAA family ATPase [Halovulum dunhuangense]